MHMSDLVVAGDSFIWITSVAAGMVLCLAAYRGISAKALPAQSRALLGEWFGYAFFHAREGDSFYKERITVRRSYLVPWRLNVIAEPATDAGETIYRGHLRCQPPFIYCSMYEPVFGDQTYEISRRIMDNDHSGKLIVGLALGNSYDDKVHCATAHIWSRRELDPSAGSHHAADPEVEKKRFLEITKEYFVVKSSTLQIKLI